MSRFEILGSLCPECNNPSCCDTHHDITSISHEFSPLLQTENEHYSQDCQSRSDQPDPVQIEEIQTNMFHNASQTYSQLCDVHNNFNFQHRGIHIANHNIRHLKPKLDDMKVMLSNATFDNWCL